MALAQQTWGCSNVAILSGRTTDGYAPPHEDTVGGGLRLQRNRRFPSAAGGAAFDGVEHGLAAVAVGEVRRGALAGLDAVEQVLDRVDEGVLVADDVPGWP